jgi:hypothetical protein
MAISLTFIRSSWLASLVELSANRRLPCLCMLTEPNSSRAVSVEIPDALGQRAGSANPRMIPPALSSCKYRRKFNRQVPNKPLATFGMMVALARINEFPNQEIRPELAIHNSVRVQLAGNTGSSGATVDHCRFDQHFETWAEATASRFMFWPCI